VNIILPVHHIPPRYSAGAELYTLRLAHWLIEHGHMAEVVCVERVGERNGEELVAEHDTYAGVPVWRLSLSLSQPLGLSRSAYDNPAVGRWFAGYLARSGADVLHLQSGYLLTASVLAAAHAEGVPAVLTLHDFWFLCPRITMLRGDGSLCAEVPADPAGCAWCLRLDSRRYRVPDQATGGLVGALARAVGMRGARAAVADRRERLRAALVTVGAAIAPSHFLARMFADQVDPARLHVLRYGVDAARLGQAPAPPDDGVLRLGYVGQIAAHKGVDLLVRAVQMLPPDGRPVLLTIYGDLDQHARYGQQLRQLVGGDPRIRLAGRFEHGQVTAVLGACDAIVVPSIWYENSPLAIMEAHAAGRPVITSALGGMAELVRDEIDGLHFRPGHADDLARQLQRLRADLDLLPRLRRGVVAPASIDDEMRTLMDIYQRVIGEHSLVGDGELCGQPSR
jgi:glycosyltransferase involved in cell wall biosynthesis